MDIAQKHISIHIDLQSRIRDLIEIQNRLFIIAVSVIGDSYEEFVQEGIARIEVSELEEIVLGSFPIVREKIGIGKHLIRKDVISVLEQSMQCKPFGEDEISVFEQSERNQAISVIQRRIFDLHEIGQRSFVGS